LENNKFCVYGHNSDTIHLINLRYIPFTWKHSLQGVVVVTAQKSGVHDSQIRSTLGTVATDKRHCLWFTLHKLQSIHWNVATSMKCSTKFMDSKTPNS